MFMKYSISLPDELVERVEMHRRRLIDAASESGNEELASKIFWTNFDVIFNDYLNKNFRAMFKRDMLDDVE